MKCELSLAIWALRSRSINARQPMHSKPFGDVLGGTQGKAGYLCGTRSVIRTGTYEISAAID